MVVGAGLTGLTTAVQLARIGCTVAVIEARRIADVTTGHTTGKVSLLQGTKLGRISDRYPPEIVRAYVDANRSGQSWLTEYCRDFDVPVQVETAYTYATSPGGAEAVAAEFDAASEAGLDVYWDDATELPFPVSGAIALDRQVQLDPVELASALERDLRDRGVPVVENVRVRGVGKRGATLSVDCDAGRVTADRVVLATGTPILDRGSFFARLEAQRSYCIAVADAVRPPRGMYLSAESPTRSLRYAPTPQGELLLVGGNGHTVGRGGPTQRHVDDLVDWTRRHFSTTDVTHVWSAQDYHCTDQLPTAGGLLPGNDRILVASGYDKWGMTNAVAAATIMTDRVRGEQTDWAHVFDPWAARRAARSVVPTLELNGTVAVEMVEGWVSTVAGVAAPTPKEGTGHVRAGFPTPQAVCTVDGRTHRMSAVCPHLGGIVRWNEAERSWDCPLHGSRFAADGTLLEGPATRPLVPRDD